MPQADQQARLEDAFERIEETILPCISMMLETLIDASEAVPGDERHGNDRTARHANVRERNVFVYRPVEEQVLLQDNSDLSPQPGGIHMGDIHSVDHDLPALRRIESL